jgi:hypothetical protein
LLGLAVVVIFVGVVDPDVVEEPLAGVGEHCICTARQSGEAAEPDI